MRQASIPTAATSESPTLTLRSWAAWSGQDRLRVALWFGTLAVALAVLIKTAPIAYREGADLTDPSIGDPEALRRGLSDLGISPETLALISSVAGIVGNALQIVLAWFILRAKTWMATVVAIGLVALTAAQYPPTIPDYYAGEPVWIFLARLVTLIGMSFFFTLPFIFPSGRFVPGWTAVMGMLAVLGVGQFAFFPDLDLDDNSAALLLSALITILPFAVAMAAVFVARLRDPERSVDAPAYRRARWALVLLLAVLAVVIVEVLFVPADNLGREATALILNAASTVGPLLLAIYAQVYRYRRVSTEKERQQTKWVVYGLAISGAGFVIGDSAIRAIEYGSGGVAVLLVFLLVMPLLLAALPVTLAIAMLRHRLFDIDLIINRTLVYLFLTGLVVGTYALIVAGVGRLIDARDNVVLSVIATGLVAIGFQPVRERVQRGVNRLLYGERDEPYGVLSRLGQRLEGTIAPDEILPAIVRTLTESLRLPYAAITLNDGPDPVLATAGTPVAGVLRLPLVYQSEPVGELVVAPRSPGERFGPADRRLLADLARQAGIAAHAVRLTVDLQRARERLVTTREEERRRLRRDLHDGLGSQLSALAIQAAALRSQIDRDPEGAAATAIELRTELKASVAEIRRLVHGLRPPSLDELGLVGALRERARRFEGPADGGPAGSILQVSFDAPADLPVLPAAIEVALYRIMEEALTNVVRHSSATRCSVRLARDDRAVRLSIADDGIGLPTGSTAGIGLRSMRERAAELGGACAVTPGEDGGTIVRVRLPLPI